jgi:hypothetical protein
VIWQSFSSIQSVLQQKYRFIFFYPSNTEDFQRVGEAKSDYEIWFCIFYHCN